MRPLALALLLLPPLAHAETNREHRAVDHIALDAGTHLGLITGGDFDLGPTFGVRATLGVRVSADVALEASALAAGDILVQGYTSTGYTFAVAWFPDDILRVSAGLRYRRFTDGLGFAEALGNALAHGFIAPWCPHDDPDCARFDYEELVVWDMGAELSLASQWHWSVFTLAVEWISLYQPLAVLGAERVFHRDDGARLGAMATDVRVRDLPRDVRYLGLSLGVSL